jgi:hypothetical protein
LAGRLQAILARWRWQRIIDPSPSDVVAVPTIKALETRLSS